MAALAPTSLSKDPLSNGALTGQKSGNSAYPVETVDLFQVVSWRAISPNEKLYNLRLRLQCKFLG
ncbi:hypothetical protein QQP08_007826 [Theobroma cacao]|nr:hypothetical protein QQP08_007826 [Theobroma cacao]